MKVQLNRTLKRKDDFDQFTEKTLHYLISGIYPNEGLYTMNPDGTERQLLFDKIRCLGPRFSPVDSKIVMYCNRYGWDLFVYDVISGKLTPITNFPSDETSPSWSPDGEWIVFESNMDDTNYLTCSPKEGAIPCNDEIYKIRSDGSNLTRLTFNNADDGSPVWGR